MTVGLLGFILRDMKILNKYFLRQLIAIFIMLLMVLTGLAWMVQIMSMMKFLLNYVEYTNSRKIGAKTLFATHYHELTVMEEEFDGIVNYNIAAKKRGDGITFLRKIVRGSTDDSYGIEVAKLAGLPNEVIKRAREVLAAVEETSRAVTDADTGAKGKKKPEVKDDTLISFDDVNNEQVINELKAVDLNTISPLECMSLLFDLKKRLQ